MEAWVASVYLDLITENTALIVNMQQPYEIKKSIILSIKHTILLPTYLLSPLECLFLVHVGITIDYKDHLERGQIKFTLSVVYDVNLRTHWWLDVLCTAAPGEEHLVIQNHKI